MNSRDVVFCVRPHVARDELQYALRSLGMMPHGRVFMVGGMPDWVVNVEHVPFSHAEKWMAFTKVWDVIRDLPLSAEFVYTEDDYFITAPVEDIPNFHQGPLADKVKRRVKRVGPSWSGSLQASYDLLVENGIGDPLSFDVHIPMVVELDRIPSWPSPHALRYRDLVGNTASREPVRVKRDVKCAAPSTLTHIRDAGIGFLSSSDRTFERSGVRAFLHELFPEPCRYEKEFYMDDIEEPIGDPDETVDEDPADGCAECGKPIVVAYTQVRARGTRVIEALECGHRQEQ